MANPKPHQMMTCPYNSSHQIEHYKMHLHLQKCKKQYLKVAASACPFDATHVIRDVGLDYHIEHCPKRILLDSQIYITDDDHRPVVEIQPTQTDTTCEENWEDDYVESYDPIAAKRGAPIITKSIKGATKSQRKAARKEGRLAYTAAVLNQQENQ